MADGFQDGYQDEPAAETRPARPRFNIFTLVLGLATLFVSGYVLSDGAIGFPDLDFRWLIAGGAVFAGLMMIGASFKDKRPGC